MQTPSQRVRLIILFIYLALLLSASKLAFSTWFPPTTVMGLWLYSGLAAILFGNLLFTPFFTKPADAVSYCVTVLFALAAVHASLQSSPLDEYLWDAACGYTIVILAASILCILTKDYLPRFSGSLAAFADAAGGPRSVFSILFLFALVAFHRHIPREFLVIGLSWALLIGLQPIESAIDLLARWRKIWRVDGTVDIAGEIVGHESPGIVLVSEYPDSHCSFGDKLLVTGNDGKLCLALVLDHLGFAEGRWLRALEMNCPRDAIQPLRALLPREDGQLPRAVQIQNEIRPPNDECWAKRDSLVGLVAIDSDVTAVNIDLVRTDLDLKTGALVEVRVKDSSTLYQIINGLTRDEILQQKNRRGYVSARARKIGNWDVTLGRFSSVHWVPAPNAPVFLVHDGSAARSTLEAVGFVPGTSYPVNVDPDLLVTHNCAILGVLGIGKTYLTLELVERNLRKGIKTICLDLTNQYADELSIYLDPAQEQTELSELDSIGPPGRTTSKRNVEEGGSINAFRDKLREQLGSFLDPNNSRLLKIYNPARFEVWKQDSRQYQNEASMASLTPTEITKLITDVVLEILQAQGMTDSARCCLVFEEAHSLIPEWSAAASEGDRAATNGTARAILQGRKYGLGCFVISQRTANVTKSILNQCNTIFALRVFDATGMEFLRNYVGEDYAGLLSTLEDRHAVVFGRGSSCRDPVLIQLNDRRDFLSSFRASPPSSAPSVAPPADSAN